MAEQISKDMTFGELLKKFPKAAPIIAGFGLHCVGCHIGIHETIEEGARAHGMSVPDLTRMMQELNQKAV